MLTPKDFVARWQGSAGDERANKDSFLRDFCAALGLDAPDPHYFCEDLARAFDRWLAEWRTRGLDSIREAWMRGGHPIGTALRATLGDGATVDGLFDGLDSDGALRLRLADGSVRVIHAADVFLI